MLRDFLHDEAFGGEERVLSKYLKPDLLIVDDLGMKQLPKRHRSYRLRNQGRQDGQAPENDQPSKEGKTDNPAKEGKRSRQHSSEPPSAE